MISGNNHRWIIALTGASGTIYGRRLVQTLIEQVPEASVDLICSDAAFRVMREEEGLSISQKNPSLKMLIGGDTSRIQFHSNSDIGASIASGSVLTAGMVIVPCSMKTLSGVAHGYSNSLIERAADVILKERRKLILAPRETPLSIIQIQNMLTLAQAGASIVPAMPGYYNQPHSILDLVDFFVMKLLDQMGYHLATQKRWEQPKQEAAEVFSLIKGQQ